jgi:uncharacterized protein (TIGR04255 family)
VPSFKNPPLLEAICEFTFDKQNWDLAIPGLFFEKVRDNYPKRMDTKDLRLDIRPQEHRVVSEESDRIQFTASDDKSRLQLGQGFLSVHKLRPYEDWSRMKSMALDAFAKLGEAFGDRPKPEGFGATLRYINKIAQTASRAELARLCLVFPNYPAIQGDSLDPYFMHIQCPVPDGRGLLVIETGTVGPSPKPPYTIVLDIRMHAPADKPVPADALSTWLDAAHESIERAFNESITEASRSVYVD